jgi:hypothetical protein
MKLHLHAKRVFEKARIDLLESVFNMRQIYSEILLAALLVNKCICSTLVLKDMIAEHQDILHPDATHQA